MDNPEIKTGTAWLMDSDFCGECGCILRYFEVDLCDDCREEMWGRKDEWYFDEDEDYHDTGDELAHVAEYDEEEMIPVTRWRL